VFAVEAIEFVLDDNDCPPTLELRFRVLEPATEAADVVTDAERESDAPPPAPPQGIAEERA
jgi:hypothetical protein